MKLEVFAINGRAVETLQDETIDPGGDHIVPWNAARYASGAYYYRLETGSFTQTRKMVLVR